MMPDRYLDTKSRLATPKVKAPNPYSRARAVPVPAQAVAGDVQPVFQNQSLDPMEMQPPGMPPALTSPMRDIGLHPGAEDMRTNKFSKDYSRGKNLNVYQDAGEYQKHLDTVSNTEMMQGIAQGIDRMKQLRSDFLATAPQQSDLSPTMALADFLAKGKGTAQSGYKRPANYEDLVSHISGMLGEEQKARQGMAQLAYEQAGGLKKGQEEAQSKTGVDEVGQKGYKIPQPRMQGIMMPFQQAQGIGSSYEKVAKDANDTIKSALETRKLLANPNWYTSNALKGSMVRSMGVNRITQNELVMFAGGSHDLISQVERGLQKAASGDSLLQSDRHAIEQYNELMLKGALDKRDEIHKQMGAGYNGVTMLSPDKVGQVMTGRDVPVPQGAVDGGNSEADKAQAFASQFMNLMKGK